MNALDPSGAALYAIIAICLVLIGALLTSGVLDIASRGAVLAAVVSVLLGIAWRYRHRHHDDDEGGI